MSQLASSGRGRRARPRGGEEEGEGARQWLEKLAPALRAAGKALATGAALHTGSSLLTGLANRKLVNSPLSECLVTWDALRFSCFCGASAATYRVALSLLDRKMDHLREYHTFMAGLAAGAISVLDKPERRKILSLYMTARALGVLILHLNHRGLLPTIPHFVTVLFGLCQSLAIVATARFPSLLPPSYYRAILYWSRYYTDDKLQLSVHGNERFFHESRNFLQNIRHSLLSLSRPQEKNRHEEAYQISAILVAKFVSFGTFFAVDAAVVKYMLCLFRNFWPHPPPVPVFVPFLAGIVGSLSFLIERGSRRVELMYYVFPQMLYILVEVLKRSPLPVTRIPFGSVVVFSLSLAVILHACEVERSAVSPLICTAADFLLKDSISHSIE